MSLIHTVALAPFLTPYFSISPTNHKKETQHKGPRVDLHFDTDDSNQYDSAKWY